MDSIQIAYPNYYLFYIAVIAGLYALSLYLNEKKLKENRTWLPLLLGIVRFLSVLTILFLLLSPLLKQIFTEEEKPIIVNAIDISTSVAATTDSTVIRNLENNLKSLKDKSADRFDWRTFYFGQEVKLEDNDSLNTLSSNLSAPLEYISEIYEDQNLGAVILVSDGIYNAGRNPLYADMDIKAPIHTIALGDTSQRRDILIKNVLHNRIIYSNDRFVIEADLQAYNARGSKTRLLLYKVENNNNVLLESRDVNIDQQKFFKSYQFELEAGAPGNTKYILSVSTIANELSTQNNVRNIYIEVLDARQKILLLANSAHPDLKYIKSLINSNKNYELDLEYASNFNRSIKDYDILILHNLPSEKNNVNSILQESKQNKTPLFFIVGNDTKQNLFNNANDVLYINGENFSLNNVTPVLVNDFSVFTLSDQLMQEIESFVPLKTPFGDYTPSPTSKVLLSQKIGNIETPYPLLAYSDINGHKQAVLCGEGLWRWSLTEFFEKENSDITKELVLKTIQYISQKEDKRQFRSFTNKRNYQENENIFFDAQLYNDNYELINDPEASLSITNENNERFDYIFSKNKDYYTANAGRFPEGNYSYNASTSYNGRELSSTGKFTVQSLMKENYDLTARHDILNQLSQSSGGELILPAQSSILDSLLTSNNNIKTVMYQQARTRSILEWPLLLLLILFLLSLEWFARRYFGAY